MHIFLIAHDVAHVIEVTSYMDKSSDVAHVIVVTSYKDTSSDVAHAIVVMSYINVLNVYIIYWLHPYDNGPGWFDELGIWIT
jgi:hypothetical protein